MASNLPSPAELLARAEQHLQRGERAEAIAAFTQGLEQDPAHPDAWFNLAWTLRAERRFAPALAAYAEAIARGVTRPEEAHLNRAVIFSEHLFDVERACAELLAALALEPGFVTAWLNLANIHEDLGQAAAAQEAYRKVLAIDPANGRAHARLGAIATFAGHASEAVPALRTALGSARSIEDRADILFALGAALDDLGDHADAFHAIEAGNMLAQSIAPVRYDRVGQVALVDRLIASAPSPVTAARAADAPVFICGMFRSGSTLAEQMLARDPAVTPGGELEFIPALAHRLSPYPEAVAMLSDGEVASLRAEYLRERPPGTIVTDKRCDNVLHLGLIFRLFPDARIVHTVRQPLDTILSVYFQHFGSEVRYGNDLRDAAHYYIQYRRLMQHWTGLYGGNIHTLDYDRLVEDPRGALGEVLPALGLAWEEAVVASQPIVDAVRTASVWQVRKPLHRRSSGRWRNYERQLAGVRAMLADAGL